MVVEGIDERKSWSRRHLFAALAGAAATAAIWIVIRAPGTPPRWIALVLVAAGAGAVLTIVVDRVLRLIRDQRLRPRNRQLAALQVAVVLLAMLATGVAAVVVPGRADGRGPTCEHPVELRILAAPGRLDTARELAVEYGQSTADDNDGCPTTRSHVYTAPSDTAAEALATGWSDLPGLGPRPDLWLPDSRSDADQVRAATQGVDTSLGGVDDTVVARSPLVVAVARSAAPAPAGLARAGGFAWTDLLDTADRVGWDQEILVRPDPATPEGTLAITALYGNEDADLAFARAVEARVDGAGAAGYPAVDSGPRHLDALLAHHRDRGPAGAATPVIATERAVVAYNRDGPDRRECAPAAESLLAYYPDQLVTDDLVVVRVTWRQQPEQAEAGDGFRTWLSSRSGREALLRRGLRPAGVPPGDLGDPVSEACGAVPEALPDDPDPPAPDLVEQARDRYQEARQAGRVLLALDNSGSMAASAGPDRTRREVAARAGEVALSRLGPRDEFGLWTFPEPGGGARRELAPIEPADPETAAPRVQAAIEALAALAPPDGGTPLHRTIVAGVAEVDTDDDLVTALVVVTDGEDTEDDPEVDERLAALDRTDGVQVYVVAVGEASCRIDAIDGVTRRTGGGCIDADFDSLDRQLADLFDLLWSGG